MTVVRRLTILAAALPLAACISLGGKPPKTLLTLSADAAPDAGPARSAGDGEAIGVQTPSVPQALTAARVPVRTSATELSYLKDAQWVEAPNRLFRNLLAEVIAAKTGKIVPDPRSLSIAPNTRLTGRLLNFGLDATSHEAVVTYDATLAKSGSDRIDARRFEARAPVTKEDGPTVAAALNRAANQVAGEVADWVK